MININQNNNLSILEEIYNNDLLLNQYILQTNGQFLFELEKHIDIKTDRLLSLGNPFVLFYLVETKKVSYFFHGYVPKFINYSFFNDEHNNLLSNSLFQLHTPVFQYFSRCWHHKYNLEQSPAKFFSDTQFDLFPKNGFITEESVKDLFLFHSSYPKFKKLFFPNIPFDDNISFDNAFFIEKRNLIDEYENTSFFVSIELLFNQFYLNNNHLSLLQNDFVNDIIFSQNLLSKYIENNFPQYIHIPSEHIDVQKALKSKNFDLNHFAIMEREHTLLINEWMNNPAKIFYSFIEKTKNKTSVSLNDLDFIKTGLNGNALDNTNLKEAIYFHLLYMSPKALGTYLLNNSFNIISPQDTQIPCSYQLPKEMITSIIDNNFFFFTNIEQLTKKELPISKKIWNIFTQSCSSFEQHISNYFIYQSYTQVNSTQLEISLNLSHFEYTFFIQSPSTQRKQTPLSYFNHIFRGINFFEVFNMTNSDFNHNDLEIIKNNKLLISSYVPLLGIDLFKNSYQETASVFNEIILNNIRNIDLNSTLTDISFLSQSLGFLSPIPFFDDVKQKLQDDNHDNYFQFLRHQLKDSKIENTAFIHYLTLQLILVNKSFNILDKTILANNHSPYSKILTSSFNNNELTEHQQILNTPFSHILNYLNMSNNSQSAHIDFDFELNNFINFRDANLSKTFDEFEYKYVNCLFQKSLTSFVYLFVINNPNLSNNNFSEALISFSLNFSDYLEKIENLTQFYSLKLYNLELISTNQHIDIINSIEKEMALRKHLKENSTKKIDDTKLRKKI